MNKLKQRILLLFLVITSVYTNAQQKFTVALTESIPVPTSKLFHSPGDGHTQYVGRIDNENISLPRFWQPGVYFTVKFKGSTCEIFLNDEVLYGNSHNYIEVVVDAIKPIRLQMRWKNNKLKIEGLGKGNNTISICKNTEAGIGYVEFAGINCKKLLPLPGKPVRKIEYIGNSITCGSGMDLSEVPCGKGKWYDQHNAYMSYGPLTSRALNAQWVLSSVSGIGMIHSCCKMDITMPPVFDKIDMRDDSIAWNFDNYIPEVVTICLGQNDGIQDSTTFCNAYINFIKNIRSKYADADIVCLTSPMGDEKLTAVLKNYLTSIVDALHNSGDQNVSTYFFTQQYHHGCGGHPDMEEHQQIAAELTHYIKSLEHW
ncbi:MAG: SGNH/GDSL hydrolase family protein [Ginsengibacter sp.]